MLNSFNVFNKMSNHSNETILMRRLKGLIYFTISQCLIVKGVGELEVFLLFCLLFKLTLLSFQKFIVTDWPKEDYGKFYNGDSYIILHVSMGSSMGDRYLLTLVLLNKLRSHTLSNFQPIRLLNQGF